MDYLLLILALAATAFAGVQFWYLMFLQAANRQQKRRIAELERELTLARRAPQERRDGADEGEEDEEVWAELIDDGGG